MTRVAVVTGGGRGLGRAVAEALLAEGWSVGVMGRDPASLDVRGALALPGDTTSRADVGEALRRTTEGIGSPDLLVLNAGRFTTGGPLWETDPDEWWRDAEVNLRGPLLWLHAALPAMVARGSGRVVVVGSGLAHRPVPHASAYSASKAAAQRLVEGVAAELAGTGVVLLTVSPGLVRTDMTQTFPAGFLAAHPEFVEAPRGDPGDLARLVLRICDGELDALSGRFVHVRDDLTAALASVGSDTPGTLRLAPYRPA